MKGVLFIQVDLGFNPDVAAEAATHLRFAFSGKRTTGNVYFRNSDMPPVSCRYFGIRFKWIVRQLFVRWGLGHGWILVLLSLLCLNVVVVSSAGSYDLHLGMIHLAANGLFKPIVMMNGCFILALMICGAGQNHRNDTTDLLNKNVRSPGGLNVLLIGLIILWTLAIYYPSININFSHYDWTHRHISASIHSFKSAWQLFKSQQADGFYRPLTFISLWLDYRLFATHYAGYHMQSIALHCINSLLVIGLALNLGFSKKCSWWTGFLFASAAVNFEPVVWPAARFDLLATMFTLTAMIFAIKYFQNSHIWVWTLPVSLFCYVLGIMNKESSYCFPLLMLFIIATYSVWPIQRPAKAKIIIFFSLAAMLTALMLIIRIAVYGNLGGYGMVGGVESLHFRVTLKTFISLLRAIPLPIFGVNTTSAAHGWMPIAAMILAVLIFIAAIAGRGCFKKKEYGLVGCVLLALTPVLNIVAWIGSPMQHCRYLYLPAVFIMLLLASVFGKIRWSTPILGTFLAVNSMGALSNIRVYLDMLAQTERLADSIFMDWAKHPAVRKIYLMDLPESSNGVFYFGSEVAERTRKKIPNATILVEGMPDSSESEASTQMRCQLRNADQTIYCIRR
jgi:hypothetical protein